MAVLASEAADLVALLGAGNPTGRPRFITNTCVSLRAPMRFDRPDPSDFSVLERSVLRALGVPRLDFRAAGVRERRLANDFVDTRFPQCVERERKQQARQCSPPPGPAPSRLLSLEICAAGVLKVWRCPCAAHAGGGEAPAGGARRGRAARRVRVGLS